MANILIKTKNQIAVREKPRVYFTSHPHDFELYFERICRDIFKTQDCAIYYTEDMSEPLTEDDLKFSLHNMNLFVVPVTYKLLSENDRAMLVDIPYAIKEGIPILPIMMESELDFLYSKEDKFGKLQYMNPHSTDLTAIPHEKRLADFLASKLTDEKLRDRIRAEFDAYVFLSYRKMDRAHANHLIQLVHSIPKYRDLAIWYDEFITLGENFETEIDHALDISRLFLLLVTPRLLEDPNFVKDVEYKIAKDKLPILPVEMVKTDKDNLLQCYESIPECIEPKKDGIHAELDRIFGSVSRPENDSDPEHTYLIGRAYRDGIDVEVNRDRGIRLITLAAEAGSTEAMHYLNQHYTEKRDCKEAIHWGRKAYECFLEKFGEDHDETLSALNGLVYTYLEFHNPEEALPFSEKSYELCCKVYGLKNSRTLSAMVHLALCYGGVGRYETEVELCERSYALHCELLGHKNLNTLMVLCNLACAYGHVGKSEKELEMCNQAYTLLEDIAGTSHHITLTALSNLSSVHGQLGHHEKSMELSERVYRISCDTYGEEHPDSLSFLNYLALAYDRAGKNEQALAYYEKSYHLHCKALGEVHPDTLRALQMIDLKFFFAGDYQNALRYKEKEYALSCQIKGEEHEDTISILDERAFIYSEMGNLFTALNLYEKVYRFRKKALGDKHPDTLSSLHILACAHFDVGMSDRALVLIEDAYTRRKEILGANHPDTISSEQQYFHFLKFQVVFLTETAYSAHCEKYGEDHPESLNLLRRLADAYKDYGDIEEAVRLYKQEYEIRCRVYGENHCGTSEVAEIVSRLARETNQD